MRKINLSSFNREEPAANAKNPIRFTNSSAKVENT
jgi:hypothetical protein